MDVNKRTFSEAAFKFLEENQHKRSIALDERVLKIIYPYVGNLPIKNVHIGTLQKYISDRKAKGIKTRTINMGLQIVRHILNVAANEWRDEEGRGWIESAPKIKLLPENDKRKPYPLSWEEQESLFKELPEHLRHMSLFGVNTGCRDQEICRLKWNWELKIKDIDTSVFIIPGSFVKNGQERVVILNRYAKKVIETRRGLNYEHVFTYKSRPITRMLNNGWRKARVKSGLQKVRVHDLKHTFGHRLRVAGVSFEDRQDLLGHKSQRITTHYSAAELTDLIYAANKVCEIKNCSTLTLSKLVDQHRRYTDGRFPEEMHA